MYFRPTPANMELLLTLEIKTDHEQFDRDDDAELEHIVEEYVSSLSTDHSHILSTIFMDTIKNHISLVKKLELDSQFPNVGARFRFIANRFRIYGIQSE